MLTIQPKISDNYGKAPNFGNHSFDSEYADFEEVATLPEDTSDSFHSERFDIDAEKTRAKHELDLWEQTKDNLDSIAKTTEAVPVLRKGTQVLSGLISVAIGWGGLRWGTVGTLEVLSKIGKTDLVKGIKKYSGKGWDFVKDAFKSSRKYISNRSWFKSIERKAGEWKHSALESSVGRKYTEIKDSITSNSLFIKATEKKNNAVAYVKNLNPKRVFVETMGVAGGGTAAVNTIGGKAVDGSRHNVEQDSDGNFYVDGRRTTVRERDYGNVA